MDMRTNYLGLNLKNPLIVSANRLSEYVDNIKKMEESGASAVVMLSIFEEEIQYDEAFVDHFMQYGTESFSEALSYFPNIDKQARFLDQHLNHLTKAVKAVDIPIIGSLNAITHEGWLDYALKMQETGISALELNLYNLPTKQKTSDDIENYYVNIAKELKSALDIPLAIKLSPFFTSIADMAKKFDKISHVDGMVLFNRFIHPDFDINNFEFKTDIQLSTSYEARLPLRWIATLHGHLKASLGATTGVHTSEDVIKYLLAGADAVMCASCLFENGIDHLESLLTGLEKWMQDKQYNTIDEFRGLMSKQAVADPAEFERAQYMKALRNFKHPRES